QLIRLLPDDRSIKRDSYFVSLNFDIEFLDFCERVDRRFSSCQAVNPSVPRALNGQIVAIYKAFRQRTASMSAGVVQREKLTIYIKYGDDSAADLHGGGATSGQI